MRHLSRTRWLAALSSVLALAPMQRATGQSGQTGKAVPHAHAGQMDPDHHFLRDLADHNEAIVYLAHSAKRIRAQYVKEMGASSEPVHRLLPIVRIDEGEVVPSSGYLGCS